MSGPVAATRRVDRPRRASPWARIAAGTADHQVGAVEQLLGLAEPGNDVTAEDQVGVGITHHQDVGHGASVCSLDARQMSTLKQIWMIDLAHFRGG